jgi:hypothetical protein
VRDDATSFPSKLDGMATGQLEPTEIGSSVPPVLCRACNMTDELALAVSDGDKHVSPATTVSQPTVSKPTETPSMLFEEAPRQNLQKHSHERCILV